MIKVGLLGSRYSGKDRTARVFKQIGVPIFGGRCYLKILS
jgi:dephospho-CoA kinase